MCGIFKKLNKQKHGVCAYFSSTSTLKSASIRQLIVKKSSSVTKRVWRALQQLVESALRRMMLIH